MKKILIIFILSTLLFSCFKKEENIESNPEIGKANNLYLQSDKDYVKEILDTHDADNVSEILNLVSHYNIGKDKKCVRTTWTDLEKIAYDEADCVDEIETNSMTDADCRITAFSLIADHLEFSKKIENEGSYLMFDVDVIDNNEDFEILKNKRDEFVTLFNEMDVNGIDSSNFAEVFPKKWEEYGIKLTNDKLSLISFVIHDPDSEVLFVGHAGILIELEDKFMFIEKIAFGKPYQITLLSDKNALFEMFSKRSEYFTGGEEFGPFVYENDKLIYTYNSSKKFIGK